MTLPASNAELASIVATIREFGKEMEAFLPFSTEEETPEPDAAEVEKALAILDQSIIF
ncbi:hypothetical protein [Trueperella pyogenes]|uniref:hypothetical protein n=1 Tax=Trueperella pyogenes TaxID=1661 RepID=UPI00345CA236